MRSVADFRDYQARALDFLLRVWRGYLAAKAGAGKTAIVLALMEELMFDRFEVGATLIVAPKRVVPQWAREARKWSFGGLFRFREYLGPAEDRKAALSAILARQGNVLVVSFEFFPELMKAIRLKKWPFGLVVFDEASRLRSGGRKGSVGWKAMNAISGKTGARIVLMSGSPRPGTAHELFAPTFLLDRGQRLGTTLGQFRADYLEPDKVDRTTGQVFSWRLRPGLEEALYGRIRDLYFAVAPDLGLPSVEIDRWVNVPPAVAALCQTLKGQQVINLDELAVTAPSRGTVTGKLHQMGQGAVFDDAGRARFLHDEKLDELEQIIEEVDGPIIVVYWYTHDLARLKKRFPQAVDIGTDQGMEAAKAGRVSIALLHPAAAGHGVDGLQAHFSAIAWFCIPASYELYEQTNARVVRSGQTETVRIYRIAAANAIVDPLALQRLATKEAGQDGFYRHLEGAAA